METARNEFIRPLKELGGHERIASVHHHADAAARRRAARMTGTAARKAIADHRNSLRPTLKVPVNPPLPMGKFVGVFSQPRSSFAKWRSRGINVLIASEPEALPGGAATVSQVDWRQAARNAGLPYYDRPSPLGPEEDARDPWLLGFLLDDEPDRRIILPNINAAKKEPDPAKRAALLKANADYVAAYEAIAARCRATGRPVMGNFSGPDVTGAPGAYKGDGQKPLLPSCSELAGDWYPKNKNAARYPNSLVGQMVDLLITWNREIGQPDKPFWLFLECSYQNISSTGAAPTEADVDEQVAGALQRNVKGVIWFPQKFAGFAYDGLTDQQAAKVAAVSAALGGAIATPADPPADPIAALNDRVAAAEAAIVGLVKAAADASQQAGDALARAARAQQAIAAIAAAAASQG